MFLKHKLSLALAFIWMLGGGILTTSPSAAHAATLATNQPFAHASSVHTVIHTSVISHTTSVGPFDGFCPGNETTCGGGCQNNGIVNGCISVDSHRNLHATFFVDSGQTVCMPGPQFADPILYVNNIKNQFGQYAARCYGGGSTFSVGRDGVLNNDGHDYWFAYLFYTLPNGSNGDWITPNQYL
jgi:hypothetical protein